MLARQPAVSFLGQILHDGQYHADPHPGNVLVDTKGTIWLLDFGAVGRLDPMALDGLRGLASASRCRTPAMLARAVAHFSGDDAPSTCARSRPTSARCSASSPAAAASTPKMMGDVLDVMQRHGLRPPKSISLLSRAMLTLDGTLPDHQPVVRPRLGEHGAGLRRPDRERRVTGGADPARDRPRPAPLLQTLPEHAEALATQLRAGRMTLRTSQYSGEDRFVVERWLDRIILAGLGGVGAVAAALILIAAAATSDEDMQVALWAVGFGGLLFSTVLLMRSVATVLRRLPLRDE